MLETALSSLLLLKYLRNLESRDLNLLEKEFIDSKCRKLLENRICRERYIILSAYIFWKKWSSLNLSWQGFYMITSNLYTRI